MDPKYIFNEKTRATLPFDAATFQILKEAGWRIAKHEEYPVDASVTGYMVSSVGDVHIYNKVIMGEQPEKWRAAQPHEVEAFLKKGNSAVSAPPKASGVSVPNTGYGLTLVDGSDISGWTASAIREYAAKHYDPAPAWPGNMNTEALRDALAKLDHESVADKA